MNNCEIIRDLLPLYADEICSESSKQLVEEHIAACESCKNELEDYRYNTGIDIDEIDEKQALQNFSKRLKKSNLKKTVISVVLCLTLIFSVGYIMFVPETTQKYTDDLVNVKIPVDEGIDAHINLPNYRKISWFTVYNEEKEVDVYLTVKHNLFTRIFKDSDKSDNFWRTNGFGCVSYQDGGSDYIHPDNTVKNIYYVDGDITKAEIILSDPDESNDSQLKDYCHLVWTAD